MSLPMDLTEKMLSREEKYTGAFLSVHVDQVSLPNGHTSFREVVEHVDGVAVLPLDERNNVITVSQYRYVFGKTLLEIPAGKKKFLTNIIDIKIPGYALLICFGTVFLPPGKSNSTYPGYIHTPAKMLVSVSIIFYFLFHRKQFPMK